MADSTELENADSNHLWLKISPADQQRAWQQAQCHSNPIARYNAYLNRVCLNTFINWLENWLQEQAMPHPLVWPSEDSLPSILEVVNGVVIELGQTRLVLVPSETRNLEELCVPQEWVDISSWAADYYLAVEVSLDRDEDECWMRVCGFTTHCQLKNEGRYNLSDRTYCLAAEQLTKDLTIMQITLGLRLQEEVAYQPTLSEAEAETLLLTLGNSSIYSPRLRLDVPFGQWAALLADERWRQQLYDRRLGNRQSETSPVAAVAPGKTQVNLSQWFQQIFEAEWHPLHALLDTNIGNLACNVRSYSDFREAPVKGVKLIDLGMEIGGKFVALLVALTQEADQKVGILVQVHPTRGEKYLPPNLRVVLSESGETLQTIQSRSRDYCIQLNRFQGLPGTSFTIQITLGKFSITEDFLI